MATVNRRDISLREDVEAIYDGGFGSDQRDARTIATWHARLDGRLSDGMYVDMERIGETSKQALASLEAALKENGWEIK